MKKILIKVLLFMFLTFSFYSCSILINPDDDAESDSDGDGDGDGDADVDGDADDSDRDVYGDGNSDGDISPNSCECPGNCNDCDEGWNCEGDICTLVTESDVDSCSDHSDSDHDYIMDCQEFSCYRTDNCCLNDQIIDSIFQWDSCSDDISQCGWSHFPEESITIESGTKTINWNNDVMQERGIYSDEPIPFTGAFNFQFELNIKDGDAVGFVLSSQDSFDEIVQGVVPKLGFIADRLQNKVHLYNHGIKENSVDLICENGDNAELCKVNILIDVDYIGNVKYIISDNTIYSSYNFSFGSNYHIIIFANSFFEDDNMETPTTSLTLIDHSILSCNNPSGWESVQGWNPYINIPDKSFSDSSMDIFNIDEQIYLYYSNGVSIEIFTRTDTTESWSEIGQIPSTPPFDNEDLKYGEVSKEMPTIVEALNVEELGMLYGVDNPYKYHMFYLGEREKGNKKAIVHIMSNDGSNWINAYKTVSTDELQFIVLEEQNNVWYSRISSPSAVVKEKDTDNSSYSYNIFFIGTDNNGRKKIGRITSSDLNQWNPPTECRFYRWRENVEEISIEDELDIGNVGQIEVSYIEGMYLMWIVRIENGVKNVYFAVSGNGDLWYEYYDAVYGEYFTNSGIEWISVLSQFSPRGVSFGLPFKWYNVEMFYLNSMIYLQKVDKLYLAWIKNNYYR